MAISYSYVIGIDEVGRGPLAGPVTVCAFAIPYDLYVRKYVGFKKLINLSGVIGGQKNSLKNFDLIQDSKTVKEGDRMEASKILCDLSSDSLDKSSGIFFSITSKSAKDIDKFGISVCIQKLISKNLQNIMKKIYAREIGKRGGKVNSEIGIKKFDNDFNNILVLLDGSLKAPLEFVNQKTIIKGDAKEKVISCASILAKVHRDNYMKKLSKKSEFSKYDFHVHKGYGTLRHMEVIRKEGLSREHRRSFCKKLYL